MANAFAGLSGNLGGILKNWYAGPIVTQFNDSIPLYREMEKGKEKYNGLQVVRPLKVRRNPGIGATSDGGLLPVIASQTVVQAQISAKYNYLRAGITGPMLKASQGDKGSFVSAMEYEMNEGLNDLKNDINRQLFWNGDGTIATVSANAVASNTVVATGRTTPEPADKYLAPGLVIDIYSSAGTLMAQGVTIVSMTGTTTVTMVLSAAVTTNATDIIVHSNSFNNEIQGIRVGQDGATTTIFNVDRSLYAVYQGNSISAASAQLSLALMQQAYNEARRRGDGKIDAVYCDFDSERYYNKLLVADKRYVGRVAGDGTFSDKDGSYIEWAGVKVIPDKDCTLAFYFLDVSTFKKYILAELEWTDETGSYMIAQTSSDSFEMRLRFFANIFPEKPSANARLHTYLAP